MSFTGGCACGNIRYECTAEKPIMANCHCRDCQRASGGAYAPVALVPGDTFKVVKGEPKHHSVIADSGNPISRAFCPECGSPLFGLPRNGTVVGVRAASLDDPSWFKPMVDIYTASAQPWDVMDPRLPKFEKAPPPRG